MFQSSLPVAGERVRRALRGSSPRRGFNPRSPSPGSVSGAIARKINTLARFQSSLPVAGERVPVTVCFRRPLVCFNPRSPSPGSVSTHPLATGATPSVSILAPRRRGACRLRDEIQARVSPVSILAPRRRGACHRHHHRLVDDEVVSILAPRRRGACRGNGGYERLPRVFQSSLPVAGERVSRDRHAAP